MKDAAQMIRTAVVILLFMLHVVSAIEVFINLINCCVCDSLTTHSGLVVVDLDCNVYIPALYSVRVYMCVD